MKGAGIGTLLGANRPLPYDQPSAFYGGFSQRGSLPWSLLIEPDILDFAIPKLTLAFYFWQVFQTLEA